MILRDFVVGGANHQYAAVGGTSPLWLRLDLDNQPHPSQSGPASREVPPEGYDQIIHFVGVRTESGQQVAAAVEQEFQVFTHTFHYGTPPDDWSFLRGDPKPF